MDLFVTCADGLEEGLCSELEEFGFQKIRKSYRGVYVEGGIEAIYRINYCSRLASKVLMPIARFHCGGKEDLYRKAAKIDWSLYLSLGKTFAIDANVSHPRLRNSMFASQVLKDAICDFFRQKSGKRPSVDTKEPDLKLNLYIQKGFATISIDTSGAPLSKRGYRLLSVQAPLQETLAAAILRLASYSGEEILFDPCCGSGTFLVEAALIATNTPPGYLRKKWGFQSLVEYKQEDWLSFKEQIDRERKSLQKGMIFGIDQDSEAVDVCRKTFKAAGFLETLSVQEEDFRHYKPKAQPSLVICNPPYGERLESKQDLKPLYRELGYTLRSIVKRPGKAFVLTGSLPLSKSMHLKATRRHVIKNANLDCRLLEFDFEERSPG